MKKILTLLVLASFNLKAHDEPKLILEYQYKNSTNLIYVEKLKADSSFNNLFEFKFIPNAKEGNITIIRHRETGKELGIIYGVPTKEFISMIYKTYFTDELIKDMTR